MGFTQDGYFNEEKFEYWANVAASEYGYIRKYSATYYIDATFGKKEIIQPASTEKSFLEKSINQVVKGNFTEDTTVLGTAVQIGIGFTGIDVITDARDIAADVINWEWSWGHAGQTVLDVVAFVPVVGVIKYGDEVGTVVKNADGVVPTIKNADEIVDSAKTIVPQKAYDVADFVKKHNNAPPTGYKGGKIFQNDAREGSMKLPDDTIYREYDVNPKVPGQNRGTERIVVGENGSVYYTADHYETFIKIK